MILFVYSATTVRAYFTGMPANVVIGQTNLNSLAPGTSGQALKSPGAVSFDGTRLFVTDTGNNRVLIYTPVPTNNNPGASVVVGQSNFNTGSVGNVSCGFNFAGSEGDAFSDGKHLVVADPGNNRVVIFNSLPTGNGACPNVAVGQSSLTASGSATTITGLSSPDRAFISNGKLFVVDTQNSRVLIYNSIPTSNGASASVVVGQTGFSSSSTNTTQSTLNTPHSAYTDGSRLFIADTTNNRVLIYNSIPTSNGASANVVLGQSSFTTNGETTTAANTMSAPEDVFSDGQRLYVSDQGNNRVLIWNSIPTTNGQPADIVVGQSDFPFSSPNQTGINATGLSNPSGVFAQNNQLFVGDTANHRVLIFYNVMNSPSVEMDNIMYNGTSAPSRIKGNAFANDANYTIANVSYSVNGGPTSNATATNGKFQRSTEPYYFDFNQNMNNNQLPGYTVVINATNSNNDTSSNLFYFQPFAVNSPTDNAYTDSHLPSFDWSVNQQTQTMRNNIENYQIQVKQDGGEWQVYLDNIPPDFIKAKDMPDRIRAVASGDPSSDNGTYENGNFIIQYSNASSEMQIHAKDGGTDFFAGGQGLSGLVQWKISAIDKQGHYEETSPQKLRIGVLANATHSDRFPLAVLTITGVPNVQLSTYMDDSTLKYKTRSLRPMFYGIADASATITMDVTADNKTKTYVTTVNGASRFGLNIPKGDWKRHKIYTIQMRAQRDGDSTELPPFIITTR